MKDAPPEQQKELQTDGGVFLRWFTKAKDAGKYHGEVQVVALMPSQHSPAFMAYNAAGTSGNISLLKI